MPARPGRAGRRGSRLLAALIAVAAFAAVLAPASEAKPGLATGFADPLYLHSDSEVRNAAFQRTVASGSQILRFNLSWREVDQGQPVNPTSPSDPAYHFSRLDAAVQAATARGIQPLIMIDHAPTSPRARTRPPDSPAGTYKPDPNALGQFAPRGRASATRAASPACRG